MKTLSLGMAMGLLVGLTASAQMAPLHVGSDQTLRDEFGQMLRGTDPSADKFGHPVVEGDLVG